ncbi:hypothetical protein BDF22DRAFT_81909 [Syncephalis plumigaleata]|nr:hypothetical protein BDF22DRAFT_81909 [Syncephalis plumigaleata]
MDVDIKHKQPASQSGYRAGASGEKDESATSNRSRSGRSGRSNRRGGGGGRDKRNQSVASSSTTSAPRSNRNEGGERAKPTTSSSTTTQNVKSTSGTTTTTATTSAGTTGTTTGTGTTNARSHGGRGNRHRNNQHHQHQHQHHHSNNNRHGGNRRGHGSGQRHGPRHYGPGAYDANADITMAYGTAYPCVPGYPAVAANPTSVDKNTMEHYLRMQIEYYFSIENLCRDIYLRSHMDDEGYVPIDILTSFNRVKNLAQPTSTVLEALASSELLEVKDKLVRKRNDWKTWLLPENMKTTTSRSATPSSSTQVSCVWLIALDG